LRHKITNRHAQKTADNYTPVFVIALLLAISQITGFNLFIWWTPKSFPDSIMDPENNKNTSAFISYNTTIASCVAVKSKYVSHLSIYQG